MRRGLPTYLPIVAGFLIGSFVGFFVVDVDPAVVGWAFGAGAGLMGGAFIAALATNEPLVGRVKDPLQA